MARLATNGVLHQGDEPRRMRLRRAFLKAVERAPCVLEGLRTSVFPVWRSAVEAVKAECERRGITSRGPITKAADLDDQGLELSRVVRFARTSWQVPLYAQADVVAGCAEARAALDAWQHAHGLEVGFVRDAAAETMERWSRSSAPRWREWCGWSWNLSSEELPYVEIEAPPVPVPHAESVEAYLARVKTYADGVWASHRAAGLAPLGPINAEHLAWLVDHQVRGLTWSEITAAAKSKKSDPKTVSAPAKALRAELGLKERGGRK